MLVYLMASEPYGEVFSAARDVMEASSRTDFGFHFVLGTPQHLEEFGDYVDLGVSSFKFFMKFRGDEGAGLGMPGNDDSFMHDLLGLSADHGAMITPIPSTGTIDDVTRGRYAQAGFGNPVGMGSRPALLIIDVPYRTVGTRPMPFDEAVEEFTTSCGETGWAAVERIAELIDVFRRHDWPILYPHVVPKKSFDDVALGAEVPGIMSIPAKGYEFVQEVVPREGDVPLPKRHPSAFFGTPLASHLIQSDADTLVVTGCTTSGCVRSSVVDAFSYNYKVTVPSDAVYDRSPVVHEVNLFDMQQKYADVLPTADVIDCLGAIAGEAR